MGSSPSLLGLHWTCRVLAIASESVTFLQCLWTSASLPAIDCKGLTCRCFPEREAEIHGCGPKLARAGRVGAGDKLYPPQRRLAQAGGKP